MGLLLQFCDRHLSWIPHVQSHIVFLRTGIWDERIALGWLLWLVHRSLVSLWLQSKLDLLSLVKLAFIEGELLLIR